jgi:hypothetical protein
MPRTNQHSSCQRLLADEKLQKESTSFCEQKEAKKLCLLWALAKSRRTESLFASRAARLFLQKKTALLIST